MDWQARTLSLQHSRAQMQGMQERARRREADISDLNGRIEQATQRRAQMEGLLEREAEIEAGYADLNATVEAEARAVVARSLGRPVEALFASFSAPVAAASIAQVHKAEIAAPAGGTGTVAVKVLRPGVRDRFRRDLGLVAAREEVEIVVRERHAAAFFGVVTVDGDAAAELLRVREHGGVPMWQCHVEDAQADTALQHLAQVRDRAVAKAEAVALGAGDVFCGLLRRDTVDRVRLGIPAR